MAIVECYSGKKCKIPLRVRDLFYSLGLFVACVQVSFTEMMPKNYVKNRASWRFACVWKKAFSCSEAAAGEKKSTFQQEMDAKKV